ncbi:MAG: HEAT repeat domain-containing protein, partial [Planctomycetota bacterium]
EVTRDEGDIVIEERFGVTAEDRRPVFHSAGAFSGVGAAGIFLVNPDLVGPTDLLGISDPPRSPDEAAMAFAFGCLLGDEALVDRVVDWDAVLAASADAFSPSLPPTRGEAREALRRFRKGLLPAEIEQVVGTIRTKRHVLEAQRQEDLYYVLPGVIAADFDCAAAPHGDDWRIVRIRKSLLRGQRHDLGRYPEERLDALARKGLRFWMWARYVEEHPDYPSALEDLAEFGDRALPILEQRASGGDRSAALCLAGLGRKGLDPLLEAWRRASESDRRMIGGYIEELIAREGATPEQHAQATEPLLARLGDRGGSLSARILARRGEPIVEALLAVISDGDAVARKNCLLALARIGPPARAADSAVVALVDDPDPQVARRAKDARFSLRHPHISFRVDSQSGIPKVSLYRDGRPVRPNPRTALSPLLERGEVRLIGLPAGRFDLLIEAQYPTPPAVLLDVVLGEEVTELGRVSFPEGTVIRIDPGPDAPKPLPTIGVRAVRRGRVRYERGTFLNVERPGGLCLPPLGPGTFELVIYLTGGRGRTLLRQDIEVTGKGDLTIPIDWSAAPEK